jgi:hypothetical protein
MIMPNDINPGDCVRIPDGRIARVRDRIEGVYRVRARRKTGQTHQFLKLHKEDLTKVECPKGWMSPEGYNRYLKITLEKMRARNRKPVR